MINQRLFNWYGIDVGKDLKMETFCPRPFDTVLIDKTGSCYLCECTSWLPQSVGNLQIQTLDTILKSGIADDLRNSIADGSYRYCNNRQCSWLLDQRPETKTWKRQIPNIQIKNIRLAIDDSCNLSCPSCRTHQIFESDRKKLSKKYNLANGVIDYVKSQNQKINLHVGSDGDPFASLVYRYFIKLAKDLDNVTFSIHTNGLLVKKMYQRHKAMFEKLQTLNVSIDGATKSTYENLRRGGSYEKIMDNLAAIKELKGKHGFKFIIHFVVQADNYHEMPTMVDIAESHGADKIWFNKITNWNTFENFKSKDVNDSEHPENKSYREIVRQLQVRSRKYNTRFIEMPTLDI